MHTNVKGNSNINVTIVGYLLHCMYRDRCVQEDADVAFVYQLKGEDSKEGNSWHVDSSCPSHSKQRSLSHLVHACDNMQVDSSKTQGGRKVQISKELL